MIVAFKMQSDENDDEYVIDSSVASGQSNILSSSTSISDDEEIYEKCSETKKEEEEEEEFDDSSPVYVPDNPTSWEEKHIATWVKWCAKNFSIHPKPDPKRFPKTGAELAKYTKADFIMTCGSLDGGKLVMQNYKYFMERIGRENDLEESLRSEEEPRELKIILNCDEKGCKKIISDS